MSKELTLKITNPAVITKIKRALKAYKSAADGEGAVDGDHLSDVFSESDLDYDFVQDLFDDAFVNAGVFEKNRFGVKIVQGPLDDLIASL